MPRPDTIAQPMTGGKRSIIFRLPGGESAQDADLLSRTVRKSGLLPVIVPILNDGKSAEASNEIYLIPEDNFDQVPRVSAFAFNNAFGYDLDLLDLSAHNIASGDVRIDTILAESIWSQKLRGVASLAHALIDKIDPSVVFIAHGAEVVSRILATVSSRLGKRFMYWESAFFQGYHFIDPIGPHFFRHGCRIDKCWEARSPLTEKQRSLAREFTRTYRTDRRSKYLQQTQLEELRELKRWVFAESRPILFVPGQLSHDANVVVSLGEYENYADICKVVANSLPTSWRMLFKPHPKEREPKKWRSILPESVRIVNNVSIYEIFELSSAVATHSSNVGLEALLVGLPVIAWGTPVYAGKGCTQDIGAPRELGALLAQGIPKAPGHEETWALVTHIITNGLVKIDDVEHLIQLIASAHSQEPPQRIPWYGQPVRRLVAASRSLNDLLQRGQGMAWALGNLPPSERSLLERRFGQELLRHKHGGPAIPPADSVERQFSSNYESAFRIFCPEAVLFCDVDVQNAIDPAATILRMARNIKVNRSVVFKLEAVTLRPWKIQNLTPHDIKQLVCRLKLELQMIVLWHSRGRLTTTPGLNAVVMLRHKTSREPTPEMIGQVESFSLRCRAAILRPGIFSYLDTALGDTCKPEPSRFEIDGMTRRASLAGCVVAALLRAGSQIRERCRGPLSKKSEARRLIDLRRSGHIIFGPYIQVPTGKWRATFLFESTLSPYNPARLLSRVRRDADRPLRLTLDVCRSGAQIIALAEARLLTKEAASLEFDSEGDGFYEFRAYWHGATRPRGIRFSGVELVEIG